MSKTGIITSYLSLRLLVVRGFLDTYLEHAWGDFGGVLVKGLP